MDKSLRPDELRVIIRLSKGPNDSTRPIPAAVFQRMFNTVFRALKAADQDIQKDSRFFISHLAMGSNEFGIMENSPISVVLTPSINLFKYVAFSVYRSEIAIAEVYPNLAKSLKKLGKQVHEDFAVFAQFADGQELPLDPFFASQIKKLEKSKTLKIASPFFAGNAIGSFDGRLGDIDYRKAVWTGHLVLHGSNMQVECVFDRSKGEDAFNRFGNKRVTVTGRAIYTGDSQLPERIEVTTMEEVTPATQIRDIRGSLKISDYRTRELDH
ncbi:hypothetical protein BH10PSE7_BH10PSE7_43000 [soil metagenome]